MTSALTVSPFDPQTAAPGERLAVGHLQAAAQSFAVPDEPPLNPEQLAHAMTLTQEDETEQHVVVWDGAEAAAWGVLACDQRQNTHAAYARLIVHPQRRRAGLGRAVARELEARARAQGRLLVMFSTSSRTPAGEAFAQRLGAQAALPMRVSRLNLADVDEDLMRRWRERPEGDPYRLHFWETIPDEYLARVAALMMVMNTAPKGELDMEDWVITPEKVREWERLNAQMGQRSFLLAAEDTRSGELSGYTNVHWDPERVAAVFQGATAVRPEARGHGLGKWLKAAMLDHLRAQCPGAEYVRTGNADVNAAMLGINEAMGFRPWASRTEWQVRLDEAGLDGPTV